MVDYVSGSGSGIGSTGKPVEFSAPVFKQDVASLCSALEAPYDESILDKILDVYTENFRRGAVLWKATNRPKDGIAFRFYERAKVEVVAPAIEANLLQADHPMIPLIRSWADINDKAIASCDFDPAMGLNKTWIWLGGRPSIDELLKVPNVPESIRALGAQFKEVGLDTVRHTAVDWRTSTVNIYFWVNGEIDLEIANRLVGLSGGTALTKEKLDEIKSQLIPEGFTFATTINSATGNIERVAVYALRLDGNALPPVGERLATFFQDAKSYDHKDINIVAWSFGRGEKGTKDYIKGERSYSGELNNVLQGWGSPLKPETAVA
ncbi:prenyltransferase-like protein [Talaromyces proteolyticus]|uniref:Aromatic prenyltransferase n=1 Tax=Talaromyces proteolyticus TaxID=1131652 RepID=A0AAD4PV45_9EURO|nr:prenyltransferase-like protein [Talaromyces proteolyticus]KAH8690206.1 prenyltransferase-like protein [Talaromyces proteolyticus]